MNRMMRRNTAVLLITAILLLMPTAALADGGGNGNIVTANGFQIELVFKEPVTVGENEFHIQITDSGCAAKITKRILVAGSHQGTDGDSYRLRTIRG